MGTFKFNHTNELTTSKIQLKIMEGAAFMGGLGLISRRIIFIILHVMLNYVCVVLSFISL